MSAGGNKHQRYKWTGGKEAQKTTRAETGSRGQAGGTEGLRVTRGLGRRIEVWLGRGRQSSEAPGRRSVRAGERGLCLLLPCARWCHSGPHEPAAPRRPGVLQPLTCPVLAMAEAASGAGGATLEGERGKRPPPEGEPAAPASGVLGT